MSDIILDNYALMRSASASSRLTAQHFLIKHLHGFLLHPSIPIDGQSLRIADVATGNSIWLQDLSTQLPPSTKFHGFDISLDQAPPPTWMPSNMTLDTWDIFEEPPDVWANTFDVVHVRLVTIVVRNHDVGLVLANLCKLLKPGGWLQWHEVNTADSCYVKTPTPGHGQHLERFLHQIVGTDMWKRHMVSTMEQQGLHNVRLYSFEHGMTMARFWTDDWISVGVEIAQQAGKTPEECKALEEAAMKESRDGAAIMIPWLVWVAQKPFPVVRSGGA